MAKNEPPPDIFEPPDWSDPARALEYIRQYAEKKILAEWSWYHDKKQFNAGRSQWIRWLALVFTIVGGLIPLLIALFSGRPEWPWFMTAFGAIRIGQIGYLVLAIAAGFILMDRYFGYSTAWMRYIVAMQTIEKAREGFRLDWTVLARRLPLVTAGTPEQTELLERMIQRARALILEVKDASEKETQAWIVEFQSSLSQLEKDLKTKMDATRPGGIDVEVTDGDKSDTPVEVSLDGMLADRFTGGAGSIGYVAPGVHRVTVKAQKAGRDYLASTLVTVGCGEIQKARFTLSIP
jgi:hypothetical protein